MIFHACDTVTIELHASNIWYFAALGPLENWHDSITPGGTPNYWTYCGGCLFVVNFTAYGYYGAKLLNLCSRILNENKMDKRFRNSVYRPVMMLKSAISWDDAYFYSDGQKLCTFFLVFFCGPPWGEGPILELVNYVQWSSPSAWFFPKRYL